MALHQVQSLVGHLTEQLKSCVKADSEKLSTIFGSYLGLVLAAADANGSPPIDIDITVAEDKNRMSEVSALTKSLGQASFSGPSGGSKLPAMAGTGGGGDPVMAKELAEVKEENRRMLDRYQAMQIQGND